MRIMRKIWCRRARGISAFGRDTVAYILYTRLEKEVRTKNMWKMTGNQNRLKEKGQKERGPTIQSILFWLCHCAILWPPSSSICTGVSTVISPPLDLKDHDDPSRNWPIWQPTIQSWILNEFWALILAASILKNTGKEAMVLVWGSEKFCVGINICIKETNQPAVKQKMAHRHSKLLFSSYFCTETIMQSQEA